MIVLDASVALELVLKTARSILWADRVFDNELHTPHLIDVETLHVLRRMALARTITEREAEEAIQELQDMPIFRHPHWPVLQQIWSLRSSLTAYDGAYVALAEALNIPLFTCDAKLSRAHGHHAKIILLQ
jgi:predicted nucleic acid-binding protein